MDGEWTLDELAGRVARALAEDDVRAPNARVREVPDARAIRWYATIGLVDRPLRYEGRSARYGMRHLLQLVAVKRRQAEGRSIAEIQAELAGASDTTLRRVARLPDADGAAPVTSAPVPRREARFWAHRPAEATAAPPPDPSLRYVIPLAGGAHLVLAAPPGPDDLAAIRAAAAPLVRLLAERDLLDPPPSPATS